MKRGREGIFWMIAMKVKKNYFQITAEALVSLRPRRVILSAFLGYFSADRVYFHSCNSRCPLVIPALWDIRLVNWSSNSRIDIKPPVTPTCSLHQRSPLHAHAPTDFSFCKCGVVCSKMTLVLAFGGDQIANNNLFLRSGSNQNSSMPCVFDNDAFEGDFESALMRDWASEISDYEMSTGDTSIKAPSDTNDMKRKSPVDNDESPVSKKLRLEDEVVPSMPSESSPTSDEDHRSSISSSFLESTMDTHSASASSSSSSSSEGEVSQEADEDDYIPRRRGIQMWNSRQRWKDERKKVMKMSVTKLSEIEDPELCLVKSVLINNTIKRLHGDIRNERQAKLRHRQQRMDFFAERYSPLASSDDDFTRHEAPETTKHTSDFYDDNSCDEIFGISEDFLRVTIPDRRVSSPIPSADSSDRRTDTTNVDRGTPMDCATSTTSSPVTTASVMSCYSNSPLLTCDTAVYCSSPSQTLTTPAFPTSPIRRPTPMTGLGQCATQYRTNSRDIGDVSFPPRVPILDSVVYHSLLASLESS
ncbi:hypothetical protein JTE90_022738 [Oedothorax gibbosus]|uniref:SERTA domain-containing protein n=1 Tax=Oedothorax gibbosus TaxID=931172 RepID=A0AAV6UNX4_9ARAC|nr:hypothetical protein JTE90_022738 [Oedothorax gibbosus]